MRKFKLTHNNRMIKIWDHLGTSLYFYNAGDEVSWINAGYTQVN